MNLASVVLRRQALAVGALLLVFGLMVGGLYWKDRQREWKLREEQASHRLQLSYELITRDLARVRSDVLYVASQQIVRDFAPDDPANRQALEQAFANFLDLKGTYQQIRLLDRQGQEAVRVNLQGPQVEVVSAEGLQDKKERAYVQRSLQLQVGEVFVSEFDLNQEQGQIEEPWNPVIRFVTPVADADGQAGRLLVVNYRGSLLLQDLAGISLPGSTWLIRDDGYYLLGPRPDDAWGWLLGHSQNFADQFPVAWRQREAPQGPCLLTTAGAFAFRTLGMQRVSDPSIAVTRDDRRLTIVSHLPPTRVFSTSNQLLNRLLILGWALLLPMLLLTRFWAVASVRRREQNRLIAESEKQLRELSGRLIRIQEEERRSIAREIHDQLGQQVTAINLDLKMAARQVTSAEVQTQLQRAIDESEQLLDTLHHFATRVRPVELDDLGLHDAVESHLWEFRDRTQIDVRLDSNVADVHLPSDISENVYRLIQESLNNVLKHARASRVDVSIQQISNHGQQQLVLQVKDNGVGVAPTTDGSERERFEGTSRLGILGMRERVDLLGGTLTLDSQPHLGTTVQVTLPLPE